MSSSGEPPKPFRMATTASPSGTTFSPVRRTIHPALPLHLPVNPHWLKTTISPSIPIGSMGSGPLTREAATLLQFLYPAQTPGTETIGKFAVTAFTIRPQTCCLRQGQVCSHSLYILSPVPC